MVKPFIDPKPSRPKPPERLAAFIMLMPEPLLPRLPPVPLLDDPPPKLLPDEPNELPPDPVPPPPDESSELPNPWAWAKSSPPDQTETAAATSTIETFRNMTSPRRVWRPRSGRRDLIITLRTRLQTLF